MKNLSKILLSVIITLITISSVQAAIAEDLSDQASKKLELLRAKLVDADGYKLHLQVVVRDSQGQLVAVMESADIWKIPARLPDGVEVPYITDVLFDQLLGEKEIITLGNKKYEKAQFIDIWNLDKTTTWEIQRSSQHSLNFCGDFEGYGRQCMTIFQALTAQMNLAEDDAVTSQWTFLRAIN